MNWVTYFHHNRTMRKTILWERGIAVELHLRDPLIRSLQRFQIGETGEGVHLKQGASATGDQVYAEAIVLFIEEEKEHARLLARALQALGGELLTSHWSDNIFMLVRHLMGLQLELVVLLSAEMIAKRYYRVLYEGTQDTVLRTMFGQICDDEEGHIAFHCDFLRVAWMHQSPVQRWFVRQAWRIFFWVVCLMVAWDHRGVLGAVQLSPRQFLHDCDEIFDGTMAAIFGVASRKAPVT